MACINMRINMRINVRINMMRIDMRKFQGTASMARGVGEESGRGARALSRCRAAGRGAEGPQVDST